jgi:phospholipid/cholesterol/gamma-HCH transport system substrate-binding protein
MGGMSGIGRIAAVGAAVAAVVLVAIVLFGSGGSDYTVKAHFINAGQLVNGNPVQSGGVPIGSVQDIRITDNGEAEVTLNIDDQFKPLHQGTRAAIRQFSQSGIANRYVDLTFPPNGAKTLHSGDPIGVDSTTTAVDLDELFNTLDDKTRHSLQGFFKGQAKQFQNEGVQANVGFQYLNPALATSSRLFNELTRDTPVLERFLVDSSRLLSTVAARRDDLAALIGNLNTTFSALGNQQSALADSIQNLPPFMRRANTTFVNLRAALNDVDPLVNASKPVAKRLGPFFREARAFAAGAKPTVRDLSAVIRRPGKQNDLIDFVNSVKPLEDIAIATKTRSVSPGGTKISVGNTQGSFPATAAAFKASTPEFALARPYTTDFLGWFDDFSTTGAGFDATGAMARAHFGFQTGMPSNVGDWTGQHYRRCPGASEAPAPDGSNVLSASEQQALDCTEADRAVK